MTLEERVDKWYKAIMNCNICDIRYMVKLALMEQDRETRRACAEAVISVKTSEVAPNNTGRELIFKAASQVKEEAHSAVMNCKGGVE